MPESATAKAEADALVYKISTALQLVPEDDPSLFRHCVWEVCEMIKVLNPCVTSRRSR